MTETELLKQESIVTKHVCGLPRAREGRDGVSLGIAVIRLSCKSGQCLGVGCTHAASHDENWVLELLRTE